MNARTTARVSMIVTAVCAAWTHAQISPGEQIQPARPALLLVDPESVPHVEMAWTREDGERVELEGDRSYSSDIGRTSLGENVSCYVAVGGSRLLKGAGHPEGAIVRVGFYKENGAKAFFDGLGAGGRVRVRLTNVTLNQPVDPQPASIVQHLKYSIEDLESCGLPGSARDQFTTVNPDETLNDRIRPGEDTRAGALSGEEGSMGSTSLVLEEDGTITMEIEFAYPLLRHMSDPWQSDLPGTFLEPIHFHIEYEVLPEGVEPLDIEKLRAESEALRRRFDEESNRDANVPDD